MLMRVRETQPNKISRKEMVTAKKRKEKKKKRLSTDGKFKTMEESLHDY